jgi:DNA repair photolyase
MSLIRQTHGGKAYQSQWGTRMRGTGPYAELLRVRFTAAIHRLGLDKGRDQRQLDCTLFRAPQKPERQLSLF